MKNYQNLPKKSFDLRFSNTSLLDSGLIQVRKIASKRKVSTQNSLFGIGKPRCPNSMDKPVLKALPVFVQEEKSMEKQYFPI